MPRRMYELVVRGSVPAAVVSLLEGFEVVSVHQDETAMRGMIIDQSHLHGILDRVASLGLELARVSPVDD